MTSTPDPTDRKCHHQGTQHAQAHSGGEPQSVRDAWDAQLKAGKDKK